MLHTNCGELALLFDTYCRVWRAGGQASLTTSTKDGLLEANLKLQLGDPAAARAGAPPPQQRLSSPSLSPGNPRATRRRPCHRGPAAKAKSRARAALHQAANAAAALASVTSSEGVSPSNPAGVSPNLPKEVPPSYPDGVPPSSSESSPPAASAPVSGQTLPPDPVEATPPLPAPEGVSSPASPPTSLVCDLPIYSWLSERCGKMFTSEDELRIHTHLDHHPEYCISNRYSTPCPYKKCFTHGSKQ